MSAMDDDVAISAATSLPVSAEKTRGWKTSTMDFSQAAWKSPVMSDVFSVLMTCLSMSSTPPGDIVCVL